MARKKKNAPIALAPSVDGREYSTVERVIDGRVYLVKVYKAADSTDEEAKRSPVCVSSELVRRNLDKKN